MPHTVGDRENAGQEKLIEVALPLEAISKASAREKSIRHGHPSTLHLWWARRPLVAARAVIFAQMVDDPSEYIDVLLSDPGKKRKAEHELRRLLEVWESRSSSDDKRGARPTLEQVIADQERQLTLHPVKTRIVDETQEGFDFLGYHFQRGRRWPREKSRKKFRDTIRSKTPRTSGQSLKVIIAEVNHTLRGWFEYFKHSHRTTFREVDGWTRGRLRSLLRHQQKRKGRGRGSDHPRWPNRFFAEQGLFSLGTAHRLACQSLKR